MNYPFVYTIITAYFFLLDIISSSLHINIPAYYKFTAYFMCSLCVALFLPNSLHKNLLTKVKYFLAGFLNYLTNLFLGMTKRLALCSSLYELADFMF
ncbi:hypothetical protein FYJ37_17710, partial [[Clostridium] scindens]|nr:hypothetical protein [[Clostridium] scindens]